MVTCYFLPVFEVVFLFFVVVAHLLAFALWFVHFVRNFVFSSKDESFSNFMKTQHSKVHKALIDSFEQRAHLAINASNF